MSALPIVTGITPEEYLERERAAQFKSEYHAGRMYAMADMSYRHWVIVGNLTGELQQAFKGKRCTAGASDLRVRIDQEHYVYPDVVVVCEDAKLADDRKDTLLNPRLVIEVLSPSTEGYDRGSKAAQYRKMESLTEYVFVSQTEPRIEIFRRSPQGWILTEQVGVDGVCHLESVGCDLSLASIYEKINFDEVTPQSP